MGDPLVIAEHLHKVFPQPGGDVVAVHDSTFTVEPGTIFGLLGPNGAGKSTTQRMLVGLMPPTSGTARICGIDVRENPRGARAKLGYLSASSGLPARLTCREVLSTFARLQGVADGAAAAAAAIERFEIEAFADRYVEGLSTGMLQRVRIAAATIHMPPVLMFDEPTSGLDVVAADGLLTHIERERARGAAVIFSTHVLREAERLCDKIAIIHEGRIRATGTLEQLLEQAGATDLDAAFLNLVRPT